MQDLLIEKTSVVVETLLKHPTILVMPSGNTLDGFVGCLCIDCITNADLNTVKLELVFEHARRNRGKCPSVLTLVHLSSNEVYEVIYLLPATVYGEMKARIDQ